MSAKAATLQLFEARMLVPAMGLFGAGGLAYALPTGVGVVSFLPLAISVVLFGLPHGAVDHTAAVRAIHKQATFLRMAVICGVYLAISGVYLAAWLAFPVASMVFFLVLTLYHWGSGDRAHDRLLGRAPRQHRLAATAQVLARGGLPMLMPFIVFPDQALAVVNGAVGLFGREIVSVSAEVRSMCAFILISSVGAHFYTIPTRRNLLETTGLVALFGLVPPVPAIGLYFVFWHSLRHLGRLTAEDETWERCLVEKGSLPWMGRMVWDTLPFTLGAILLIGAIVPVASAMVVTDPYAWLGVYLVLLAIVTLPHAVVVALMDRAEEKTGSAAGLDTLQPQAVRPEGISHPSSSLMRATPFPSDSST